MSGKVKWFTSSNINAPTLDNNWGALVNVLSKCLIDGYGAQTLLNIVIENGVAIASFGTAHKFEMFQWVEISGSSNSVLNDEFRILGATNHSIEFLIDLPDQTITETLSCRLAPLGWSKPYSDEGRAVFQAKNTDNNPYYLRVDDTCDPLHTPARAKFAKVGILESCTGIDDISGNQAPFDPTAPTKNWIGTGSAVGNSSAYIGWAKWPYATADTGGLYYALSANTVIGVRSWILVGDDENFYVMPSVTIETSTNEYKDYSLCHAFGIFDGLDCPYIAAWHDYNTIGSSNYGGNSAFTGSSSSYLILLKNKDGSYVQGSNTNTNDTRLRYGIETSGYSGYTNVYKYDEAQGLMHCAFLARDALGNYLGEVPLARVSLNQFAPAVLPNITAFSDGDRAYLRKKLMGQSIRAGSIIFDLGEI